MPHGVLDVVAEHPQEQHVADQVKDRSVQEDVGDERQPDRHERDSRRAELQRRKEPPE